MDWTVTSIVASAWIIVGIIFFGAVGMAIYSTVLQRRGLRTAESLAARHPQSVENSRRALDLAEDARVRAEAQIEIYKTRHEQVLEALARQTAVLEKILAVLEGSQRQEGIKTP
jgi:hypothetical protein